MNGVISALIIGLIVGLLARAVMPGRQSIGILWTIVIGILGAFVGNFIGDAISPNTGVHWIMSVLAAVVLLALLSSVGGRRRVY